MMTMPRNWRDHASIKVSYDTPIHAPVAKGTPLGKLVVSGNGVPSMEAQLVAGDDVHLGIIGESSALSFGDKFHPLAVTGDTAAPSFKGVPTFNRCFGML